MTTRSLCFWIGILSAFTTNAAPAHVRFYCESLRFGPATVTGSGESFTLELTSDQSLAEINGELVPLWDPTLPTHAAMFRISSPNWDTPIFGQIAFDMAQYKDENGNGYDDFFEVSQSVSATTFGLFTTPVDNGTVVATWSRAAGSRAGTCRLRMTGSKFGQLPDFTPDFEIIEYAGTFDYSRSRANTNTITGTLQLTQSDRSTNRLSGSLTLTRIATNRFDELIIAPGSLVDSNGTILTYSAGPLDRDTGLETNYFGFTDFDDGDPSTTTADYLPWVLSIDDTSDSNNNGIPDLSDDMDSPPPDGLELALNRAADELTLTLRGNAGQRITLQGATSLTAAEWTTVEMITLTSGAHVISIPIPSGSTRFWRAHLEEPADNGNELLRHPRRISPSRTE